MLEVEKAIWSSGYQEMIEEQSKKFEIVIRNDGQRNFSSNKNFDEISKS